MFKNPSTFNPSLEPFHKKCVRKISLKIQSINLLICAYELDKQSVTFFELIVGLERKLIKTGVLERHYLRLFNKFALFGHQNIRTHYVFGD